MGSEQINYLRISVTDRCNLRCSYCRPDNIHFLPQDHFLRYEEIRDIVEVFAEYGLKKVRITGGEPLLRRDIHVLVGMISEIEGIKDISMTTNGILIPKYGKLLKERGLKRLNISLDSLREERFRKLTGGHLKDVLRGIEEAKRLGFDPIKINVVLIKGFNEDEVEDFILFGKEWDLHIRFIELMPVGFLEFFDHSKVVHLSEIKRKIEEKFGKLKPVSLISSGASRDYLIESLRVHVGFISPMSLPFCEGCKKLRLTSDGRLKLCLRGSDEINIKDILRKRGKEGLRKGMENILEMKRASNIKIAEKGFIFEETGKSMISIGG